MCGIVGYVGYKEAGSVLLTGLKMLEYRGYDSAGVATVHEEGMDVRKTAGRVLDLERMLQKNPVPGVCGISHTRWATHGLASDRNAHPHADESGKVVLVHNGVIENHAQLRQRMEESGHVFASETDTEVIARLIGEEMSDDADATSFRNAVIRALSHVSGTYGILVMHADIPGTVIGVRMGSPLVIGVGEGEYVMASDAAAIAAHTDQVMYMSDGDVATVTADSLSIQTMNGSRVSPSFETMEYAPEAADKGSYEHFMLKEIYEQPETVQHAMRGHVDDIHHTARFGGLNMSEKDLRGVKRIILSACGTSWHAALVGEYLIEEFARIPVEVEYASELRYRNAPLDPDTLFFCLSQSGETADTLAALREFTRRGVPTLGIVNTVGSSIAQEAQGGIYLHAGPEIGVASTKAFVAQVVVLTLVALYLGRQRGMSAEDGAAVIRALQSLPEYISQVLRDADPVVQDIARKYKDAQTVLYMGRGYHFPVALEGALKLKEISYIHAEGYPAAEMKHGPIALVDEHTPSVIINPKGVLYDKVVSNLEEIKARKGPVISIASEGDAHIAKKSDAVITIPDVPDYIQPILAVIPLQLLSYHMALLRECDVDKPRNLAKSVTVE